MQAYELTKKHIFSEKTVRMKIMMMMMTMTARMSTKIYQVSTKKKKITHLSENQAKP